MQRLSAEEVEHSDGKWAKVTHVHRQSWAHQVLAAAVTGWVYQPADVTGISDAGDIAGVARGAVGGWLHGMEGSYVTSGLHPDLGTRGEIVDKRTAGEPSVGGGG